jgi:Putative transmembrane protein (PGPGW)
MFFTPGPGWLVIFLGLTVLAAEFVWAQRDEPHEESGEPDQGYGLEVREARPGRVKGHSWTKIGVADGRL